MNEHVATPGALGATAIDGPAPAPAGPTSIVMRSEYDNIYGVVARRSELSARIVRESVAVREALRTLGRWIIGYLTDKGLRADQIIVNGSMTPEGVVVLHIEER